MYKRSFDLLRSAGFLLSLFLLILNDHLLKDAFGTWWTGKLSDLAGLFAVTLFWLSFFPRHARIVAGLIGLGFLFWKLPLSDSFIEVWNGLGVLHIGRVIDPTDLIALLMIPLALYYAEHFHPIRLQRLATVPVLLIATVAFTATSCSSDWLFDQSYPFHVSQSLLSDSLRSLEGEGNVIEVLSIGSEPGRFRIDLNEATLSATKVNASQEATVEIVEEGGVVSLHLTSIFDPRTPCSPFSCSDEDNPNDPNNSNYAQREPSLKNFEESVIEPLRKKLE